MGVIDDGVVTISVDFMIHCVVNEKVENGNRDHKLLFWEKHGSVWLGENNRLRVMWLKNERFRPSDIYRQRVLLD